MQPQLSKPRDQMRPSNCCGLRAFPCPPPTCGCRWKICRDKAEGKKGRGVGVGGSATVPRWRGRVLRGRPAFRTTACVQSEVGQISDVYSLPGSSPQKMFVYRQPGDLRHQILMEMSREREGTTSILQEKLSPRSSNMAVQSPKSFNHQKAGEQKQKRV